MDGSFVGCSGNGHAIYSKIIMEQFKNSKMPDQFQKTTKKTRSWGHSSSGTTSRVKRRPDMDGTPLKTISADLKPTSLTMKKNGSILTDTPMALL